MVYSTVHPRIRCHSLQDSGCGKQHRPSASLSAVKRRLLHSSCARAARRARRSKAKSIFPGIRQKLSDTVTGGGVWRQRPSRAQHISAHKASRPHTSHGSGLALTDKHRSPAPLSRPLARRHHPLELFLALERNKRLFRGGVLHAASELRSPHPGLLHPRILQPPLPGRLRGGRRVPRHGGPASRHDRRARARPPVRSRFPRTRRQ